MEFLEKLISKNNKIIENVELLLGDGVKKIQPNEYITINSQKKCLYAKTKIKKGHKINKSNLEIKGPSGGISPKYFDVILGKKVNKDIEEELPIRWEDI